MIVLDTSAVLAAIDVTGPDHDRVVQALYRQRGPFILPVATLSECTYLIERSLGNALLKEFLASIARQEFALDCGEHGFDRILVLVEWYESLPLGFSNAAVIACGERNGGAVATLDLRHFGVVAHGGTIQIVA